MLRGSPYTHTQASCKPWMGRLPSRDVVVEATPTVPPPPPPARPPADVSTSKFSLAPYAASCHVSLRAAPIIHPALSCGLPACLPARRRLARSSLLALLAGGRPSIVCAQRPAQLKAENHTPRSITGRPHTARRRPPRRDNLSRRNTTTILLLQYILRTNAIAARAGGEDRSTLFFYSLKGTVVGTIRRSKVLLFFW